VAGFVGSVDRGRAAAPIQIPSIKFNNENGIARVTQGGAAREIGLYISMHPRCETVYQRVPVRGIGGPVSTT
jgi:hypothetical protein